MYSDALGLNVVGLRAYSLYMSGMDYGYLLLFELGFSDETVAKTTVVIM